MRTRIPAAAAGLLAALALTGCPTKKSTETVELPPVTEGVDASPYELPPISIEKLGNGLQVVIIEDHKLPIVIMGVTLRSGSASDPADKAGLTEMMTDMLLKGTESKSALDIAEAVDFVGGQIQASTDDDYTAVTVKVLKKDFPVAIDTIQDVVMRPTFPKDQLAVVKQQLLGEVTGLFDSPQALGAYHAKYLVYGEDHPYSFHTSERSVTSITRADIQAQYDRIVSPDNAYLVVAGDVDKDNVYRKVKLAFGPWEKKEVAYEKLPQLPAPERRVRIVNKPDLTQSTIYIAHAGITPADDRYYPALLMNYALGGGGFSSRLMKVVRSEGGKTYGVGSSFSTNKNAGMFVVTTSTRNEETVNTIDLLLEELDKAKDSGITESELKEGKGKLIGSYPLRLESLGAKTQRVVTHLVYDLGVDAVRNYRPKMAAVTLDEANEAAKQLLHPDDAVIVIVGKASEIQDAVEKKFGEVEVVDFKSYAHSIDSEKSKAER